MAPREFTIPSSTRLVRMKDSDGGCYDKEIAPEYYNVMKNAEHQEWLQREALEEFVQLDWTTERYPSEKILEMSRTWDSEKKCCTVDGRVVDLSLDALSSIFRLRGYGKKSRKPGKFWVSRFFEKSALRSSGYLTSKCKSNDVGHLIKFVTLTLHVNWIRAEAPRSVVQAVELSRNPERKDWLGRMVHAFWKAMDKSQKMAATYVQVLLKAHLRIILDFVLRPDVVLPKSVRTRVAPTADLIRHVQKKKTASIILQRARVGNAKPLPRTRLALTLASRKQAQTSETPDLKECNEPEPGEKEESNGSQLDEEDAQERDSVVNLREEGSPENLDPEFFEKFWGYADGNSDTNSDSSSDKEGTVHAGVEMDRKAEEIPGGVTYMDEMDVDPPTLGTVDENISCPEFWALVEPLVGLIDAELLKKMEEVYRESRREVNRERRERIKSQNCLNTIKQENHELQQQLNNERLQVMCNQKSKVEEEAAWREKHVDPVLEELAAKEKYILALRKSANEKDLELEQVREQRSKFAKELASNLKEKGRLEKEAEDLKTERVEQGKNIKGLEERVGNAQSELETTRIVLETSQKMLIEREKSLAGANTVLKGLQGRIEKMPWEIRKCYKLNMVPQLDKGSKKRKTEQLSMEGKCIR